MTTTSGHRAGRLSTALAAALVVLAPAVAAAQSPAAPAPIVAPEQEQSGAEALLLKFKIKHPPVTPKDFVVKSRAAAPRHDFMPVGVTPPDRVVKVKSASEITATTAALDARRGAHDRLSGRKPEPRAGKAKASDKASAKKRIKAAAAPRNAAPAN